MDTTIIVSNYLLSKTVKNYSKEDVDDGKARSQKIQQMYLATQILMQGIVKIEFVTHASDEQSSNCSVSCVATDFTTS